MKDAKGHGSAAHQVSVDQLGHSPLTTPDGGYINNDVRDAYRGDVYGTIRANGPNGEPVGHIDYASGGGKINIHMIQTAPTMIHKGIASQMMDRLKTEFPGHVVKWGGTTPEGEAFKRSYYKKRGLS